MITRCEKRRKITAVIQSLETGDPIEVMYRTEKRTIALRGIFQHASMANVSLIAPRSGSHYHMRYGDIVSIRKIEDHELYEDRYRYQPHERKPHKRKPTPRHPGAAIRIR